MMIKAILLHEPLPRKKAENCIVTEGMTRIARTITDTKFRGEQNGIFFGESLFPETQIHLTNIKRTAFTSH
jgi:hypothetical protein